MIGWVKTAWRGETRLWKAFWIYGAVGTVAIQFLLGIGVAVGFGVYAISGALSATAGVAAGSTGLKLLLTCIVVLVPMLYAAWAGIVIWKCAFNTNLRLWGYLAKIVVSLGFIGIAFNLYGLVFLGGDITKDMGKDVNSAHKGTAMFKACDDQMQNGAAEAKMDINQYELQHHNEYYHCQCVAGLEFQAIAQPDPKAFVQLHLQQCDKYAPAASGSAPPLSGSPAVTAIPADAINMDTPEARACTKTMVATANAAGVLPKDYIFQNADYLKQCIKFYQDNPTALKP